MRLVTALEAEQIARLQDQPRPKTLGELPLVTLDAEVCDWHRFNNHKQIGSYTICMMQLHYSKMGNGVVTK